MDFEAEPDELKNVGFLAGRCYCPLSTLSGPAAHDPLRTPRTRVVFCCKMLMRAALVVLILIAGLPSSVGQAQRAEVVAKLPSESDSAFASRVLKVQEGYELHTLTASWNGVPTIFVDYLTIPVTVSPERPLIALQRTPAGAYRKLLVTVGESEGGAPDIEAIGFANADHDPAKELIVILAWNEPHYGACGPVYEVRVFDDPKPSEASLRLLPVSKHFGVGCEHFRFKTVAAVKRELTRLGY
jgi:hypothetical protein